MRVGIIALLHESNTFISEPTTIEHFQENTLLLGDDVRQMADSHHEVAGFFQELEKVAAIETVPLFAGRATPYGTITAATHAELMDLINAAMDRAGRLDGLLVAPHGATVSEPHPDVDGHWLGMLRDRLGPEIPIIGTLDAHANLSQQMVSATDALVAYRTNPHLDQLAVGQQAARLMINTLDGSIRPTMAAAMPAMAINIEKQQTAHPPCLPLYQLADQQLEQPAVLSNSILLGFPYADVEEMGSSAIVVTNDQPEQARQLVDQLGDYLWQQRQQFVGTFLSIEQALAQTATLEGRSCLLDMGDNVGGGSPADSTLLLHALVTAGQNDSFVCLYDPPSVQQARQLGKGGTGPFSLGARTDQQHGSPFESEMKVLGFYEDGHFHESQPRHGGMTTADQGPTAVLQAAAGVVVMVTSRRMPPFSLSQLTTFGVDPTAFRLLVAKGVNLPIAAYEEVCDQMVRVNTAGVTTADMRQLEYQHRRRPLYPFEDGSTS